MKVTWVSWVLLFTMLIVLTSAGSRSSEGGIKHSSKKAENGSPEKVNSSEKDANKKNLKKGGEKAKAKEVGDRPENSDSLEKGDGSSTKPKSGEKDGKKKSPRKEKAGRSSGIKPKSGEKGGNKKKGVKGKSSSSSSKTSGNKKKGVKGKKGKSSSSSSKTSGNKKKGVKGKSSSSSSKTKNKFVEFDKKGKKRGSDSSTSDSGDKKKGKNKKDDKGKRKKGKGFRTNKQRRESANYGCACTASGDPHFTTCDKLKYDYQGECNYTLVTNKNCPNSKKSDITFEVIIETKKWGKSTATVTLDVTIFLSNATNTLVIRLDEHRGSCLIDGVQFPTPRKMDELFDVTYEAKLTIFDVLGKFRVEWDNRRKVQVRLHDDFKGAVCGLCGNYNDEPKDDLIPSGATTPVSKKDINKFGGSWERALDRESECAPVPKEIGNACDKDPEVAETIRKFCGRIKQDDGPFGPCINDEPSAIAEAQKLYGNCLFDACADPARKSDQCVHAEDMAKFCRDVIKKPVGVWQDNSFCAAEQCVGGKVFRKDYLGDRTCIDPTDEPAGPADTGCFCPDGMLLDGDNCVTPEGCGCSDPDAGIYLERGTSLIMNRCRRQFECTRDGSLNHRKYRCDSKAKCEVKAGREQCVCRNGYEGNGLSCKKSAEELNTIGVASDSELPDSAITTSSNGDDTASEDGRLENGKCWKPANDDKEPRIDVGLLGNFKITGVRLEACPGKEYTVNGFDVEYSKDGKKYRKAQKFTNIEVKEPHTDVFLKKPIRTATDARINPVNTEGVVGLSFEFLGERSDCKKGYIPLYRGCYLITRKAYPGKFAKNICAKSGGYLAEIYNAKENAAVRRLARGNDVRLGIRDVLGEDRFLNEHHGTPLNYDNFKPGHQFDSDNDCVKMTESGEWEDISCDAKTRLVCEQEEEIDCQKGWKKIQGGCYKKLRGKYDFKEAVDRCAKEGGHLAQVTSYSENKALSSITRRRTWISLLKHEGIFGVYPKLAPLSFTSWGDNEPNNFDGDEDCAITNAFGRGKWGDVKCSGKYTTICELGVNINNVDIGSCDGDPCKGGNCIGFYNPKTESADHVCKCKKGRSGKDCGQALCHCFAWGDPHYGTCDGRKFNYQGICSYVMAKDGCEKGKKQTFEVAIETVDFPKYKGTSRAKNVFIYLFHENLKEETTTKTIIKLGQKHTILLDGKAVNFPCEVGTKEKCERSGKWTLCDLGNGVIVKWDGHYRAEMDMDGRHQHKICGMCGNFNGDDDDDIHDSNRNNRIDLEEINEFAVRSQFDASCGPPPEAPESVESVCEAADPSNVKMVNDMLGKLEAAEGFDACKEALGDATIKEEYNDVRMDGCSSGDVELVCAGIQEIAELCSKAGHSFCWDPEGECAPDLGENEEYLCGSGGELICGDTEEMLPERIQTNYDGPVCKDGYRRLNDKCVDPSDCGCSVTTVDGSKITILPNGEYLDNTCEFLHKCHFEENIADFKATKEIHRCHPNARCESGKCVCLSAYRGDGYQCRRKPNRDIDGLVGFAIGATCGGRLPDSAITTSPPGEPRGGILPGRLCEEDVFFRPPRSTEKPADITYYLTWETVINAIVVRGSYKEDCYAEGVRVYSSNDGEKFTCIEEDAEKGCKVYPTPAEETKIAIAEFTARFVKIEPVFHDKRSLCIQVELYGIPPLKCSEEADPEIEPGCYRYHSEAKTYPEAAAICASTGGYLAEVSSHWENKLIGKLAGRNGVHLGLRDTNGVDRFRNPKGSPWQLYSNYAPGEPNVMANDQGCIVLKKSLWRRSHCNEKQQFVCEYGGDALDIYPAGVPIGAEFGKKLSPSSFTSSSSSTPHYAETGRLNYPGDEGWVPSKDDKRPWLQVKYDAQYFGTGFLLQGCVEGFTRYLEISYSADCQNFEKISLEGYGPVSFPGPTDSNSVARIFLPSHAKTGCVRFSPLVPRGGSPVCLRVESYGRPVPPPGDSCQNRLGESLPDSAFSSSSCPQDPSGICAPRARFGGEDYWSPGSSGACEFSGMDLGRVFRAYGLRVAAPEGAKVGAFRVQISEDGITWKCGLKVDPEAGDEVSVEARFPELVMARYFRLIPLKDDPKLQYEILGCSVE